MPDTTTEAEKLSTVAVTQNPDLRQRIQNATANYEKYFRESVATGAASENDTQKIKQWFEEKMTKADITQKDVEEVETLYEKHLVDRLASAHKLFHVELMDKLLELYNRKPRAIPFSSLKEWSDRFKNPKLDYKDRERFIKSTLPEWISKWTTLADQRSIFLKEHPELKSMSALEVPHLDTLLNEDAFLNLSYPARKELFDRTKRILKLAAGGKETKTYAQWKSALEGATKGTNRFLHPSKVQKWLDWFKGHKNPAIASAVIAEYMENWRDVRSRFDGALGKIHREGIPKGYNPPTLDQFLLSSYHKRLAHIDALETRLSGEKNGEMQHLKSHIWSACDMGDFEDAAELVTHLRRKDPKDPDIPSMERYIKAHQTKAAEQEAEREPDDVLEETRTIVNDMPQMSYLLHETIRRDTADHEEPPMRTRQVGRTMYNLDWARQRGYSDENAEIRNWNSDRNKEKTEEYVQTGHSGGVEHNILGGRTATKEAIRGKWEMAQIVYMSAEHESQVAYLQKIEDHKSDERFGYWTDLRTEMPYEKHLDYVYVKSKRIKENMRYMRKHGIIYSTSGAAEFRPGVAQDTSKAEPKRTGSERPGPTATGMPSKTSPNRSTSGVAASTAKTAP
ncbi:MAG: hypothetical protein Q7R81_04865 [Candidatus Peregrinibacteria bacterium]|nr:hypothetical protein [Candidatus Peregrinibacteria bacterium]